MKIRTLYVVCAVSLCAAAALASSGWIKYPNSPTAKDINAVKMLTPTNGWAVGYWGEILRYSGGEWFIFFTWPTQYLQDVDFSYADFGFAVGYQGVAIRFDGTSWVENSIPSTANFYAVGVPPTQRDVAWAAGSNGNLWKWSGGVWTRVILATTRDLHDIYWESPTNGWMCGNVGTVYRSDGSIWTAVSAFTTTNFYCIYALSPYNVWVGGDNGQLWHYEGVSWARVYTPVNTTIREMAFNSPTDGWAVCDGGKIIHYNGVNWAEVEAKPPTTESFSGLNMPNEQTGWAVGKNGTIYEYRNYPGVEPSSLGRVKATLQ